MKNVYTKKKEKKILSATMYRAEIQVYSKTSFNPPKTICTISNAKLLL